MKSRGFQSQSSKWVQNNPSLRRTETNSEVTKGLGGFTNTNAIQSEDEGGLSTSEYISSENDYNKTTRDAAQRVRNYMRTKKFSPYNMPQNGVVAQGLPLMVEVVMDSQVFHVEADDHKGEHYSHTGNSWNQSDIDEAYRNYYSKVPIKFKDSATASQPQLKSVPPDASKQEPKKVRNRYSVRADSQFNDSSAKNSQK